MPDIIASVPLWVRLDYALRDADLQNVASKRDLEAWAGNDVDFNFGVFDLIGVPASLANVAAVTLEVRDSNTSGATLLAEKTLTAGSITPTITAEDFAAYQARHFKISLTKAETSLAMPTGQKVRKVWLCVYALMVGGAEVTLGAGWFYVFEDAGGSGGTPPPVPPSSYYTQTEIDGMLALKAASVHTHVLANITDMTAFSRSLAAAANAAASRSTLGLATVANTGSAADLTGTLAVARLPFSGVTAGSGYNQFTVDTYGRITAAAIAAYVTESRTVSTIAPLSGGGALSSNLTLSISNASDTAVGAVELATPAEVVTGTDTARAVTPAGHRAALVGYVDPIIATRAASGYLYSDGATSGRGQIQVGSTRTNLAGAPVATWCGWVEVPTAALPTGGCTISVLSSQSFPVTNPTFVENSIYINLPGNNNGESGNKLQIAQLALGADNFSNRSFSHSTFRTVYAGQRIWLEIRLTRGTANPIVRVNGVDISSAFVASTGGTVVPEWLASTLVPTFNVSGGNWPAGTAPLGQWLNAHLADAESESWRLTGRPPAWVAAGASMVNKLTSTFANSVGRPLDTFSGASATAWTATKTQTTLDARVGHDVAGLFVGGLRYRVEFNLTLTSGIAPRVTMRAGLAAGLLQEIAAVATAGANSYEFTPITSGDGLAFEWAISNTFSGSVSGCKVTCLGALSLPGVQPIPVLDDLTGIGGNTARLVGMVPVTDRRDWRIVTSTATNGNQQLLGGALFTEPERHRIDSWVVNNVGAATRTVSLGQSSAATTYVNAASCPVGRTEITLASRFPAAAQPNLWANSNGTDQLVHTITGHRVGAS